MQAIICNKAYPDLGCATIPLPIPDKEYAHCMELLEGMQIGGVKASDCYIDQLNDALPYLDVLEKQEVNIDELDFLARSLERFIPEELAKFQSVAASRNIRNLTALIDLSICCECATVITDFSDLETVGKHHYLDLHGGAAPVDTYNALNGEAIARELIADGDGRITPYGVLYENGMQLEPACTEWSFPAYADKEYLIEVELAPSPAMPEDTPPITLFLPMPEKRLERLLERGGYRTAEEVQITTWHSQLPDQVNIRIDIPREGLIDLNRMYQTVSALEGSEMTRLAAAVIMAKPVGAAQVRRLAENLELFDFVPNIKTAEDYGKFMIQKSGHFDYDENLVGFYDYKGYGEQRMKMESGEINYFGYVCYTGTMPLDELMMDDLAEQEQGQTMGGMV